MNAVLGLPQADAAVKREARIDAVILCKDDALLVELGPMLGDRYRVHAVDAPARIGAQVCVPRWIGIVDVDSQARARDAISRLELQYPFCPLIVITARPEQWLDSAARGTVLAAVGRDQLATSGLSDALLAAESRLRASASRSEPLTVTDHIAPVETLRDRIFRRGATWVVAGALGVLLAVTGVWLHYRSGREDRARAGITNTVLAKAPDDTAGRAPAAPGVLGVRPAASRQQAIEELLSRARIALREQNLLPPPDGNASGDSALELYIQVLGEAPRNDEALDGVSRLLVVGRDRIGADVTSGKFDDAQRLLGLFRTAGADAAELQRLATVIHAARPQWLAQRAAQNIASGDFKSARQLLAQAIASG